MRKRWHLLMATFPGYLVKIASFNLCVWHVFGSLFVYGIISEYNTAVLITVAVRFPLVSSTLFISKPSDSQCPCTCFYPCLQLCFPFTYIEISLHFLSSSVLRLPCLPFISISPTFGGGFPFTEAPKPRHGWLS